MTRGKRLGHSLIITARIARSWMTWAVAADGVGLTAGEGRGGEGQVRRQEQGYTTIKMGRLRWEGYGNSGRRRKVEGKAADREQWNITTAEAVQQYSK